MPSLPSVTTSFLTAVKDALKQGSDLGSSVRGAAQNYLRAQDMASVLDLLQKDGLTTGDLTATGGTASSVQDGRGTFVEGQQIGNVVQFDASTTTTDLQGVTATIVSNTHDELFFASDLPATPVSGDTYKVLGRMAQGSVDELREGRGMADAPRGDVYGSYRTAYSAMQEMKERLGLVAATGTLTMTSTFSDGETVTIDGKTYTMQATLTDSDGNVHIGANASETLDHLIAAITLGSGAGVDYASSTTEHPTVWAAAGSGDTMDVTAKTAGPEGNNISTSTTAANGSWGNSTLTGGARGSFDARNMTSVDTVSGSTKSVLKVDFRGGRIVADELRGMNATVSGETRRILTHTTDGEITLSAPLSSAPSSSTTVTIDVPEDAFGATASPKMRTHPGSQPGENARLAELIDQLETDVTNYTLPT